MVPARVFNYSTGVPFKVLVGGTFAYYGCIGLEAKRMDLKAKIEEERRCVREVLEKGPVGN